MRKQEALRPDSFRSSPRPSLPPPPLPPPPVSPHPPLHPRKLLALSPRNCSWRKALHDEAILTRGFPRRPVCCSLGVRPRRLLPGYPRWPSQVAAGRCRAVRLPAGPSLSRALRHSTGTEKPHASDHGSSSLPRSSRRSLTAVPCVCTRVCSQHPRAHSAAWLLRYKDANVLLVVSKAFLKKYLARMPLLPSLQPACAGEPQPPSPSAPRFAPRFSTGRMQTSPPERSGADLQVTRMYLTY